MKFSEKTMINRRIEELVNSIILLDKMNLDYNEMRLQDHIIGIIPESTLKYGKELKKLENQVKRFFEIIVNQTSVFMTMVRRENEFRPKEIHFVKDPLKDRFK